MNAEIVAANSESRQKLYSFLGQLSEQDLRRVNSDGWTVAALVAHLGHMDQRMLVLLRRWAIEGVSNSPTDPGLTNDMFLPFALELEPQAAIRLSLSLAEELDAVLAAVSDELVSEIEASGTFFRFNRALHRYAHMEQITQMLA